MRRMFTGKYPGLWLVLCCGLLAGAGCSGGADAARPPLPAAAGQAAPNESASRAGEIVSAFQAAYPGVFRALSLHNDDWTILAGNTRFYWAGGRLLPESALPSRDKYSPHPFYRYTAALPAVPAYTEEEKTRLRERVAERERRRLTRHPGIFNAIWRLSDRKSAEERMKRTRFLGWAVTVHEDLVPVLGAVEKEIRQRSAADAPLRRFAASLQSVSGYHWRTIADTASLSFHAYGAALDIVPANPQKKETYWLWARDREPDWFSIPLARRLLPPDSFVKAFEEHGFVWGGKWLYFDTIHFEYRPEVLIYNGLAAAPAAARP